MSNESMSNDPAEIRRQIEYTRGGISNDVNALADAANPKNIANRQVDKVKESGRNLKEAIFGSPYDRHDNGRLGDARDAVSGRVDDARQTLADTAQDAKSQVADAADQARVQVQQAPAQVKRATRGNPLAAGLIAFGIGALVGGLIPASDAEAKATAQIKDKAQPLMDNVQEHAQGLAQDLKGPATDALGELKEHAQQSVQQVKSDAVDAKDTVAGQAKDSARTIKDA